MAFAPYHECVAKRVKGCFNNAEFGTFFEYGTPAAGEFVPFPGYETKVWMRHEMFRWAKVVATRAYVVVEEAANGAPVVEKWVTRNHKHYPV